MIRLLPISLAKSCEAEWLDRTGLDRALLAGNLADICRVNKWLGGTRLNARALKRLMSDLTTNNGLTMIDVGSGTADIPEGLLAWAKRRGIRARCAATDINCEVLGTSADKSEGNIDFGLADGRHLPFTDNSFDVAMCSLVLHHLSPDDAVLFLSEMYRVARRGIIVNDLVRGWLGYLGARALTQAFTGNAMTRHDAPLSVRRAYTKKEMTDLARCAGLTRISFENFFGFRVALIAVKSQ